MYDFSQIIILSMFFSSLTSSLCLYELSFYLVCLSVVVYIRPVAELFPLIGQLLLLLACKIIGHATPMLASQSLALSSPFPLCGPVFDHWIKRNIQSCTVQTHCGSDSSRLTMPNISMRWIFLHSILHPTSPSSTWSPWDKVQDLLLQHIENKVIHFGQALQELFTRGSISKYSTLSCSLIIHA